MVNASMSAIILHQIFVSDGHSYFGRHGQPALPQVIRSVREVECVAGRGLRGDRFFDFKADYKGQVTLFSAEVFARLCADLSLREAEPAALRRNLWVSGADLNTLIGQTFSLQGVQFAGVEECRPCYWMDEALGAGAEAWLKGRGGLRCRILTDGWLRCAAS